jgi:hypothetical protein
MNSIFWNYFLTSIKKDKRAFISILFPIGLSFLINGCSTGVMFNHTNIPKLKLGVTNINEVKGLFGEPKIKQEVSKSNKVYKILRFPYASGSLSHTNYRYLALEFTKDVLNSYFYTSMYEEDSTKFNYKNAEKIKIGKSTKADVIKLLGSPSGQGYCPTEVIKYKGDCKNGYKILYWHYRIEVRSERRLKVQAVIVIHDENETVVDVQSEIES